MPSGKVHDKITIAAAAVSVPVWWYCAATPRDPSVGAVLIGSLLFSGLLISPDLDLNSSIYKRWGPLRFLWWPYQKAVPHRSWVSHSYVFGPLLRTAYLLAVVYGVLRIGLWTVRAIFPLDRNALSRQWLHTLLHLPREHPAHFYMLLLGLLLGAGLHCVADTVWSAAKRRF